MKVKNTDVPVWDRRQPKSLFLGLRRMRRWVLEDQQTKLWRLGRPHKGKAYCTNMAMISQAELELLVLKALQDNLMDEDVLKVFCEEYGAAPHQARLQSTIATCLIIMAERPLQLVLDQDKYAG